MSGKVTRSRGSVRKLQVRGRSTYQGKSTQKTQKRNGRGNKAKSFGRHRTKNKEGSCKLRKLNFELRTRR